MAREEIRRDLAGIGPDPRMAGRLYRMSSVKDFRIADGEPDIRGWEVRTLSGSDVGEVDDLLIDPHRGEVVMLDIDLNDSDQHVNLPIRGVQLDRGRRCVIVDSGDVRSAREELFDERDRDLRDRDSDAVRDDDRVNDLRAADDRSEHTTREIRYGATRDVPADDNVTEEVVERRPVIEEVVVRRRVVDDEEA